VEFLRVLALREKPGRDFVGINPKMRLALVVLKIFQKSN
jgi:hypothetical protein